MKRCHPILAVLAASLLTPTITAAQYKNAFNIRFQNIQFDYPTFNGFAFQTPAFQYQTAPTIQFQSIQFQGLNSVLTLPPERSRTVPARDGRFANLLLQSRRPDAESYRNVRWRRNVTAVRPVHVLPPRSGPRHPFLHPPGSAQSPMRDSPYAAANPRAAAVRQPFVPQLAGE